MADEDDTLIDQLLEDGFRYESNGRIDGLAEPESDDEPVPDGGTVEPSGEPDDTGDDTGDVEPDADTGPAPDAAAPSPPGLLAGLDESEQRGLLNLRRLLIENPDLAAKVNRVLSGELEAKAEEPKAEQPSLPEFVDPDDQAAVEMWRHLQTLTSRVESQDEANKQAVEAANQARINGEIAQAVTRFRQSHPDLSEEDVANIRNHTSANVNIPGVMANFPGDPVEGLTRALEIGSLTDPQTRDKVLQVRQDDQEVKDAERGKKLSALTGGSSGTSRTPAKKAPPANWNEVAKRLAEAIEQGS